MESKILVNALEERNELRPSCFSPPLEQNLVVFLSDQRKIKKPLCQGRSGRPRLRQPQHLFGDIYAGSPLF